MSCDCKSDWRIQSLDLATGKILRNSVPFVSLNFDDLLNQVGPGRLVLPLRKVTLDDVWPHLRALAFMRTSGPDASTSNPKCEGIYMPETISASSDGSVTVGVQAIEQYLNYRVIKSDQSFHVKQTNLGLELVNLAASNGINLTASADTSAVTLDRTYIESDDPVILSQISDLTKIEGGPDYIREFTLSGGVWSTNLRFTDYAGNTIPRLLNARRGLSTYGIEVDATQHGNWEIGRGADTVTPFIQDNTSGSMYVEFDKAVQWSDAQSDAALQQNVKGDLKNNIDPTTLPDITIADLKISGAISLGDSLRVNMNDGAALFKGDVRVVGKSWSIADEQTTTCTLSVVPLDTIAAAILNAPLEKIGVCC